MTQPVVFCFDGSEGAKAAMAAAGQLVARPADAIVLTVWQPLNLALARAGAFSLTYATDEERIDSDEEQRAWAAAENGAAAAQSHGYDAQPLVEQATESVARQIIHVCDEIGAKLIVCGRRGRGTLSTALLGSVPHYLVTHAARPVLVAPEPHEPSPPASQPG